MGRPVWLYQWLFMHGIDTSLTKHWTKTHKDTPFNLRFQWNDQISITSGRIFAGWCSTAHRCSTQRETPEEFEPRAAKNWNAWKIVSGLRHLTYGAWNSLIEESLSSQSAHGHFKLIHKLWTGNWHPTNYKGHISIRSCMLPTFSNTNISPGRICRFSPMGKIAIIQHLLLAEFV